MGLFEKRNAGVPIWFMRQAGRYHSHYQNIKKNSDFMTMCKTPQLACDITMGPIDDFKFDAAILFSDLLFPLEQIGLGLNYHQGPPQLEFHLETLEDMNKMHIKEAGETYYDFQKKALELLKVELPQDKTLLGFVGAPFTLFTYAVEGSHKGALKSAKMGLYDGRFSQFMETLFPELLEEMLVQARGGADAVCIFDTAAGELSLKDYKEKVLPWIRKMSASFKEQFPSTKILYYSKHTHREYLHAIEDKNIDALGVDWRHQLPTVLEEFAQDYYVQGNIDPCWLHLPWTQLQKNLAEFKEQMMPQKSLWDRWIFGLGHGVIIQTPEENVRNTVSWVHQNLKY